jgi:hypothetical protein
MHAHTCDARTPTKTTRAQVTIITRTGAHSRTRDTRAHKRARRNAHATIMKHTHTDTNALSHTRTHSTHKRAHTNTHVVALTAHMRIRRKRHTHSHTHTQAHAHACAVSQTCKPAAFTRTNTHTQAQWS